MTCTSLTTALQLCAIAAMAWGLVAFLHVTALLGAALAGVPLPEAQVSGLLLLVAWLALFAELYRLVPRSSG